MKSSAAVASCPFDGCPLRPFASVPAPGYTIALHGCRFCDFNCVVAVATDPTGKVRPVAQWARDADSGIYVLTKEFDRPPPAWLQLACAALPQRNPT